MARSIVIASGKGGVGKTTLAINLSVLLSQAGKRTVLVDADTAMANIGIMLGIERAPINLHNVLMGEASIRDAVYEGPNKLKYVPSGLSAEKVKKLDFARLADAITELSANADFVIIDSPPGLDNNCEAIIKSAKEVLLLSTPEPASLADALKVKNYVERSGLKIAGLVINRVLHDPAEIKREDVETLLGSKLLGEIPEDIEVRRATALQIPVILKSPGSPASIAMKKLASEIAGTPLPSEATGVKKGFLQTIIELIFGKKS
ncbi:MAG: cell division ATPase MinD [Candidatus Micrarchaeia archaeon]|jgi:septum site-determining protein MinD